MKRIFVLTLSVITLCVSCGKKDPVNKEEKPTNQEIPIKKIKQVIVNTKDKENSKIVKEYNEILDFKYDDKGRVVKKTVSEEGNIRSTLTYAYEGKDIKLHFKGEQENNVTLKTNDKGAVLFGGDNTYNNKNQIVQLGKAKFIWENGNVVKEINGRLSEESNVEYTNFENKNGFILFSVFTDTPYGHFTTFYGLNTGVPTKNLVKKIVWKDDINNTPGHYGISFDYNLDKEGYITSYTRTIEYKTGSNRTSVFEIIYE